jgi:hypothetical protein
MCEILVKAIDYIHPDSNIDRQGAYKRGFPVVVMPDGWVWGTEERLPKFVVIKIPGVPISKVLKYILPEMSDILDLEGNQFTYRRRRWQIRWVDLPLAARTKLANIGVLTIKAGGYAGGYDYTWSQIKAYFRDLKTGQNETADL